MASNYQDSPVQSDSEDPIQGEINELKRLVQRIRDQIQADTNSQQEVRREYNTLSEDLETPEQERQEKVHSLKDKYNQLSTSINYSQAKLTNWDDGGAK